MTQLPGACDCPGGKTPPVLPILILLDVMKTRKRSQPCQRDRTRDRTARVLSVKILSNVDDGTVLSFHVGGDYGEFVHVIV